MKTEGTLRAAIWSVGLLMSCPFRVCSGARWARTRSYRASEPWRAAGVGRPTPSASTQPVMARAPAGGAGRVARQTWATRSSPAPLRPSCSANWRLRVTLTPPSAHPAPTWNRNAERHHRAFPNLPVLFWCVSEIARQAAQMKLMRKLEKQALARAAKEARKQQGTAFT